MKMSSSWFGTFVLLVAGLLADAVETPLAPKDASLPRVQMPAEFAMVFSFGYVSDLMPKEPAVFERTLEHMKRTGINTIHCKYADWRLKLCEEHGIMMMIDLTVPEHDLKKARCEPGEAEDLPNLDGSEERFAAASAEVAKLNDRLAAIGKELRAAVEGKKAGLEQEQQGLQARRLALEKRKAAMIASNVKYICRQVRGSKGVWGYGLWYDNGTHGNFLNHAVEKLRLWDPTHVTYVGSYRHGGLETVTINPGCYGWYDYHWKRGTPWHYLDMKMVHALCQRRGAISGNYAIFDGLLQDLFTVNTCLATGVKMIIWFIGGPMDRETYTWNNKQELVGVAGEIRALYRELMLIGHPSAYYSTPVTRTHANKPVDPAAVPRSCAGFPVDCWVQVTSGEALVGLFQYPDGTDALFVANQNAFVPQKMGLTFKPAAGRRLAAEMFNRKTGRWDALRVNDNALTFDLAEARGELLRIHGAASR